MVSERARGSILPQLLLALDHDIADFHWHLISTQFDRSSCGSYIARGCHASCAAVAHTAERLLEWDDEADSHGDGIEI
jgi:hypothetical protein